MSFFGASFATVGNGISVRGPVPPFASSRAWRRRVSKSKRGPDPTGGATGGGCGNGVLNNADGPVPLDSTGSTAPGAIGAACSLALLGTVVAAFSVFAVLVLGDDVAVSVSRGR
jgi:hypothetical protein